MATQPQKGKKNNGLEEMVHSPRHACTCTNCSFSHHVLGIQPPVIISSFQTGKSLPAEINLEATMKLSPKQTAILRTSKDLIILKGSKNCKNIG